MIDDAAVEDTEEFYVTFKGVEPHVEPDVESAEFLLIIQDNDSMGHFGILWDYFKLFVTPNTHNGNLVFLFLCFYQLAGKLLRNLMQLFQNVINSDIALHAYVEEF